MTAGLPARLPQVTRALAIALLTSGLLTAPAAGEVDSEAASDDTTFIESPLYPGVDLARGVRLQARLRYFPNADLDPGHVDRYSPEVQARFTLPISSRAVARAHTRYGTSRYDFRGHTPLRGLRSPLDLHEARLSFDGAYQLNDADQSLLFENEEWSLIGLLSASSDWEGSRFADGLGGNVGLGFGYRLEDRFRLALGAVVRSDLEHGGVDVSPYASFRWSITKRLSLRDRGLGLLLEYHVSRGFEVYASGYRDTDGWRIANRLGSDGLTFRDRRIQASVGVDWRIIRWLRLNFETGAVADRTLRVHSEDFGTLISERADPSLFVDVRFELRPGDF